MVRRLLGLALVLLAASAVAPEQGLVRLRAEFTPPTIYHGEETRCDFVLYVRGPSVEVEVVKFPEFRGYWKENLVLRQGVIPLPFGLYGSDAWNKIVIGSYRLSPMVGEKDLEISPMKLLVRMPGAPNGQAFEETILSDLGSGLKVKPLPPQPASHSGPRHSGAVGRFTLVTETPQVKFRTGEPALIRLSVHGFGNFEDVHELSLGWPESVRLLSRRAIVQGASPYQVKSFEFLIAVDESEDLDLPGPALTFFDPTRARYETAEGRPIHLFHEIKPESTAQAPSPLPPPEPRWTASSPLAREPLFWWPQALLFLGALGLAIRRGQEERRARRARDPRRLLAARGEKARSELEAGRLDRFLAEAAAIALESVQERAGIPHTGLRSRRILELAEAKLGAEAVAPARLLVAAHESHSYHPAHAGVEPREQLLAALDAILDAS